MKSEILCAMKIELLHVRWALQAMAGINNGTVDSEKFASVLKMNDESEQTRRCSRAKDAWPGTSCLTTLTASNTEALQILQSMNVSHLSTKGFLWELVVFYSINYMMKCVIEVEY